MIRIGSFYWNSGSINDNIRKLLKRWNLAYYNNINGDVILCMNNKKVTAVNTAKNYFDVYIMR